MGGGKQSPYVPGALGISRGSGSQMAAASVSQPIALKLRQTPRKSQLQLWFAFAPDISLKEPVM